MPENHEHWMRKALVLAQSASDLDEVPVGAILVRDNVIIGEGHNQPISFHDPTAHAEILALRDAAAKESNYRLPGSTLYVTIEPCTMCVGAIIHARIDTIVFACTEPKAGALVSNLHLHEKKFYNHSLNIIEGVLAHESSELIRCFFKAKRK